MKDTDYWNREIADVIPMKFLRRPFQQESGTIVCDTLVCRTANPNSRIAQQIGRLPEFAGDRLTTSIYRSPYAGCGLPGISAGKFEGKTRSRLHY